MTINWEDVKYECDKFYLEANLLKTKLAYHRIYNKEFNRKKNFFLYTCKQCTKCLMFSTETTMARSPFRTSKS